MTLAFLVGILRQRRTLRSHERWSRDELEVHQARALRELRDFAVARSTFYRELHRGLENQPLHALPIVTKAMLMDRFDDIVTDPAVRLADVQAHVASLSGDERFLDRYWVSSTSGTTGRRGLFVCDAEEWTQVIASYARANEWAGVKAGLCHHMRLAVVSSTTPWHQSARVGATVTSRFVPTLRIDASTPVAETVARLNEFQPDNLTAYASMAAVLADEQLAGRLRIAPRAIMCASEVLTLDARGRIRAAWGKEAFNVYVATETAAIASECHHHRLHLYEDLVIAETVDGDGRQVPLGEYGSRLLVTVLFSRTQPLIRYELSDSIALSGDGCPCGRRFGLVAGIQGRAEDTLVLGSAGVRVHPNVIHAALEGTAIAEWQVQKDAPDRVRVLVTKGERAVDPAVLAQRLAQALRREGAGEVTIAVEEVGEIPRTSIGKRRLIIAERPRDQAR